MNKITVFTVIGWSFAGLVFLVGILNIVQVHPVPGLVYILLSFLFIPSVNTVLKRKLGWSIPVFLKVILGIFLFMFTLGVSDLAELYGF